MEGGCIGCVSKNEDRDKALIIKKATEYAKKEQVPVAYFQEAGEWKFLSVYKCIELGIPFREVVSVAQ